MNKNLILSFFPALFLAIGIASAGYFIGNTLYKSQTASNTAFVKGLSERKVISDKASWQINFSVSRTSKTPISREELFASAEKNENKIRSFLNKNGFADAEIESDPLNYNAYDNTKYNKQNQSYDKISTTYTVSGLVKVNTDKVYSIKDARKNITSLVKEGVNLTNGTPQYKYTKLNEIKPSMLKEATENARAAANEFAKNVEAQVGSIKSASQGRFSITDSGASYGDSAKIEKNVRVITNITFYLK